MVAVAQQMLHLDGCGFDSNPGQLYATPHIDGKLV